MRIRFTANRSTCQTAGELVHEKTAGNPFFAIQFISSLAEEGLLAFDHGEGRWSWDLNRIHAKGYTDNVVDLMVGKLNRLPVETQKALQQLACLGNSADFDLLADGLPGFERGNPCRPVGGGPSGTCLPHRNAPIGSSTTVSRKQPIH